MSETPEPDPKKDSIEKIMADLTASMQKQLTCAYLHGKWDMLLVLEEYRKETGQSCDALLPILKKNLLVLLRQESIPMDDLLIDKPGKDRL